MDASAIGKPEQQDLFAAVGGGAAVSTGIRQALALIGGAVETVDAVRREAQFIQRRVPPPFSHDKIDLRVADRPDEEPRPARETRKLSLTGVPAVEKAEAAPRGTLVDLEA